MDFDFGQIPVPFRMQPGLRRVEPGHPQLTPMQPGHRLWQEKQAVVRAGASRHAVAGFDPRPALQAIRRQCAAEHDGWAPDPGIPVELAFEEDFAVLDGATGRLPWLCVCVPSHWSPEDKVGLDFAALHGPVADNAPLLAAAQPLVALVTGGACWERSVWTLTPSGRHDQHPRRQARVPWPAALDADALAAGAWLRVERQTFFPVGAGTQQAVFTIRVMLQPLAEAVAGSGRAARLHDSLASMGPAVLAYKGLAPARDRLVQWLADRAREDAA